MDNFEEQKRVEAEEARVRAEEDRVQSEAKRAHAESNDGSGRIEMEKERRISEEGRAHAESNEGTGRQEAEAMRTEAEAIRKETFTAYENELEKLQSDPAHYMTPGARKYFRRVTFGYIILSLAMVVGFWGIQNESNSRVSDINKSRAQITYFTCLNQNERNLNTKAQLNNITLARKESLRRAITETDNPAEQARYRAQIDGVDDSENSSRDLINAIVPVQDCEQIVLDRFGYVPDIKEK